MPKAKVGILCSHHSALDTRAFYKEARSLQQKGYEVTVIAPLNDKGFIFDMGNNNIASGETTLYNVRIIGFNREKGAIFKNRIISKLITLVSLLRLRIGVEICTELIEKGASLRADVYHCHEIYSLYAGIQIKRRLEKEGRKPKLIYDVHEYTPALSPTARGINKLFDGLYKKLIVHFEKQALKYVDYTITVSEAIKNYLLSQNRFIQTEVIYNCSVFPISQEPERCVEHKDKVIICHEGTLSLRRGLKRMVEVMKVLKEAHGNKVELLIIGRIGDKERRYLDQKLKEYNLHDTISCTGWLPYEKVGQAISQADIGIIFSEPTENIMLGGGLGNKVFNYMRCGLAIVSVEVPERSRIILETQCGLVVREPSTETLSEALSALIDDEAKRHQLGENARKAAYNQYGWEQMEKRLLGVYEELLYP